VTVLRLTLRAPRGFFLHWLSLFGASFALHATVILALVFLPRVFHPRLDFPDVYTVNLVSLPAGAPGPKAAALPEAKPAAATPTPAPVAAPAPAKAKPAIKIPEKPTSKPVKPKPVTKPPAPVKAKPESPTPEPESTSGEGDRETASGQKTAEAQAGGTKNPAGEGVGAGSGAAATGGSGTGADDPAFQFGWYSSNVQAIVSRNWSQPINPGISRPIVAVVTFRIQKDGKVYGIVLERSSGDAVLDRSALRAVQDSNPLPPLPYQWAKDSIGYHFEFELDPEK
jgi:TonB family protein